MQLVRPFEDHSDAYLATAALKSRAFGAVSCEGKLPIPRPGRARFVALPFTKIKKTTRPDKPLSG